MVSAIGSISSVNHTYLPYQVAQIAAMTEVQRTRIVEKPLEPDQLNKINEFLSIQKRQATEQVSNVNTAEVRQSDTLFGSNNVLSVYNQPVETFNKDFFIAYNGIKMNEA